MILEKPRIFWKLVTVTVLSPKCSGRARYSTFWTGGLDHYMWGEGRMGGSCIYLPECLTFVLTHRCILYLQYWHLLLYFKMFSISYHPPKFWLISNPKFWMKLNFRDGIISTYLMWRGGWWKLAVFICLSVLLLFWLRHPVFAMLAFLQCCCLSKDLTSPIINIFVSVAQLHGLNCVKFCILQLLMEISRSNFGEKWGQKYFKVKTNTFHWKPV